MKLTPEEKETNEYFLHRLKVRRIWLEKFLLALAIGAIIGIAGMVGKIYLENYKADLINRRFMLESRLVALKEVRNEYSNLSRYMVKCWSLDQVEKDQKENKSYKEVHKKMHIEYADSLQNFQNICNSWGLLFSDRFSTILNGHNYIHEAIANEQVVLNNEHYMFLVSITDNFNELTRVALFEETLGKKIKINRRIFEFDENSINNMQIIGAKEFFNLHYTKWKENWTQNRN